jgi:hypothetical protein
MPYTDARPRRHGVARNHQQVDQHLVNLPGVGHDLSQGWFELSDQLDAFGQ